MNIYVICGKFLISCTVLFRFVFWGVLVFFLMLVGYIAQAIYSALLYYSFSVVICLCWENKTKLLMYYAPLHCNIPNHNLQQNLMS